MRPPHSYWPLCWLLVVAALLTGCSRGPARSAEPSLTELRRTGASTSDPDRVAQWMIAELFAPGGSAKQAGRARARLTTMSPDDVAIAELSLGIDAWLHGQLTAAPEHLLRAARAARTSDAEIAPYVAWFATRHAVLLRHHSPGLWRRWRDFATEAIEEPLHLGWRARSELVDWWAAEAFNAAERDVPRRTTERYGCVGAVRLAGPFGRATRRDLVSPHPAEAPGPWPERWPRVDGQVDTPRRLSTRQDGCRAWVDEPVAKGVFYAETFLDLPADREVLLAVQGALAVWVDDTLVLNRDPRHWGEWPRFGVSLWLGAGRHRLLARLDEPTTSIRVMHPDGRPLEVAASTEGSLPYLLSPPRQTGEPNLVSRFVKDGQVLPPPDLLTRVLVAYLAFAEGQGDLAAALLEPLVADLPRTTGPSLLLSALFTDRDPVYDDTQRRDLARELQERALAADPELWQAALSLAWWRAEQEGLAQAVAPLRALTERFPDVPAVTFGLARVYGKLGWQAEHDATVKAAAARFPESPEALEAALGLADAAGDRDRADTLVKRLQQLDPDSELVLVRAIEREDYPAAIQELERLQRRRPDREDIPDRIRHLEIAAGTRIESTDHLLTALEDEPKDASLRLALADARFAAGQRDALQRALVDAIDVGGDTSDLEAAIALVEGMTELEPYRLDGRSIIAAYEADDQHLPGHAARVLDYAAVWIKSDGSSRMLEHEIVRIQSAEAISKLAEHPRLEGLALHMRVIKRDGRVLEPELVSGKPTVTLPHLEVGDYIETEQVISRGSDDPGGTFYLGPQWFFREENIAYARSEFVVISPADRELIVEVTGDVPAPTREDHDGLEVRRWRVDESPAAPNEPNSPPIGEFLPSVRLGWGVSQARIVQRFHDETVDLTPVDPRIVRIAQRIVEDAQPNTAAEQARRLYRWIVANVADGDVNDGRRVVIGKQGNRARGYETLCRALGIEVGYALVQNRIAAPPRGPITAATQFNQLVMHVKPVLSQPVWLTVGNKYAPFGYLPAEVRDMPAFLLTSYGPHLIRTPAGRAGSRDGIEYDGVVILATDGSAKLRLSQRFLGRHAMAARSDLAEIAERRLPDVLQAMIAQELRGARLDDFEIENLDQLDLPLTLELRISLLAFAERSGDQLVVAPPFTSRISTLTTLPTRQTPLLMAADTYRRVRLEIELPPGATLTRRLEKSELALGGLRVGVTDHTSAGKLVLERLLDLPAGRIQPEDYPALIAFARRADEAQTASLRISLRP